jgi:GTP cyclohydrolase I
LVQYYASRPQVQERLTNQIANGLKEALQSDDVAVMIDAEHLCVRSRGIKDTNSNTITASYSGKFQDDRLQMKFIAMINTGK